MKKYKCRVERVTMDEFMVEAENEEEARSEAENIGEDLLSYQYTGDIKPTITVTEV